MRPRCEQVRGFGPLFVTVWPRLRQSTLPLLQRLSDIVIVRGNDYASAKGIRQPQIASYSLSLPPHVRHVVGESDPSSTFAQGVRLETFIERSRGWRNFDGVPGLSSPALRRAVSAGPPR